MDCFSFFILYPNRYFKVSDAVEEHLIERWDQKIVMQSEKLQNWIVIAAKLGL